MSVTNVSTRTFSRNAVLSALSPDALSVLEPHMRHRDFEDGAILWEAGEPVERIYFPLSGIISVIAPIKEGSGIEVASIGREGAAGIDYTFGRASSSTQGVAQIRGTIAYLPAFQFASVASQNAEINSLAAACCDWLLLQSQQMAACNAVHAADARLCRWLLQCSERSESDLVPATQEAIAHALGIRRTTVTLIAQGLQMAGIISYRRGKIAIRNPEELRSTACDCCTVLSRRNWPSARFSKNGIEALPSQASAV